MLISSCTSLGGATASSQVLERRGCSHDEGWRAAWTRMQWEQAWKDSSSVKWKHAFCQPHTTRLCHPWTAGECSRHSGCGYEDPEAPSTCTKATLLDWFFTRAQEWDLVVPHRRNSCRIHTGTHDWWRDQASEGTVFTISAELFRAVGTRPFGRSWAYD